jgi:hypothetical protein
LIKPLPIEKIRAMRGFCPHFTCYDAGP